MESTQVGHASQVISDAGLADLRGRTHFTIAEAQRAGEAAGNVFDKLGVRSQSPFSESVGGRLILFPAGGSNEHLGQREFEAVAESAKRFQDQFAIKAANVGHGLSWIDTACHRSTEFDYSDYISDAPGVEDHLLFSPEAKWGVLTTHGGLAVVGGTAQFVGHVRALLEVDEARMLEDFANEYASYETGDGNMSWTPHFIAHVYGERRARQVWPLAWPDG